jgi:hypothetical protein
MVSEDSPFDKTYDTAAKTTSSVPQESAAETEVKRTEITSGLLSQASVIQGTETTSNVPQTSEAETEVRRPEVTTGLPSQASIVPTIREYGTGKPKRVVIRGKIIHD